MKPDDLKKFGFRPKSRKKPSKKTLTRRMLAKGVSGAYKGVSERDFDRNMDIWSAKTSTVGPSSRKRSIKSGTFTRWRTGLDKRK